VLAALKPEICQHCNIRFADKPLLSSHLRFCTTTEVRIGNVINPLTMSVTALKEALRNIHLSTAGNKSVLIQRLERSLASEG